MIKMERKNVTVKFDNEEVLLNTALIGGVLGDGSEFPMGMYAGHLDIGEIGIALMHCHRAVIKLLREQHGFNLEDSLEFVCFCMAEASKREEGNKQEHNVSFETHQMFMKMAKEKM
jgi:hypothetical protein